MDKCKYIIVNSTALDHSGALTILRQFIEHIPLDNQNWLIFVSPQLNNLVSYNPHVRIEPIYGVKPMYKRLWWDALGLKKWLKKHRIKPIAAVSLQNTGFNVGKKVPTYIYYHQPLPFFPFSWNPFKKQERTFWFYKHIYPFFVNLFLKKSTKIFVQLEFIKKGFAERFKHPKKLIGVFNPDITLSEVIVEGKTDSWNKKKFVYPAMPHFYKNHRVIEEALKFTDAEIEILFTTNSNVRKVDDERIQYIGMQPYNKICELYYLCDALLFPSYIETFGLPLLEAAMTGMPIIASDLPYAREVLKGYEGAIFVEYNNPQAWATAIEKIEKGKRYQPIDVSNRPGWKELFENIKIQNNVNI